MARTFTSYPSPSCPPDQRRLAPPPPHIPYEPPPSPSPPPLPTTPHLPLPPGWTRTHHAIPAAYPRRFADSFGNLTRESTARTIFSQSAGPNGSTAGSGVVAETKEERQARNEGEARELLRRRYDSVEWPKRGEGVGEEKGLYMAGERWCRCLTGADADGVKEDGAEGLTMVVTHANGLHKEMWYPTLKRLLAQPIPHDTTFGPSPASETATDTIQSDTSPRKRIDEIWLFDDVHHGASIDLNAGRIGPVHGWSDGGRDIVNFLTHVWKQDAAGDGQAYPEQTLPWRPEEGAGKKRRKVIGIGHSFGGNALVQAAAEQPDLFHALFLVDPMCPAWTPARSTIHMTDLGKWWPLVMGAARRRANWPSIEEAKLLRRSPFFAAWHEEVWDIFLSHGLVPVPPGQAGADDAGEGKGRSVQLATPPWAEAAVFGEPTGLGEGWDRLLDTPEDVKMGFLMANQPKATMGEKMTREMVWRAKGSVNEILPDAGHLAVQERPDRVADALARFIGSLSTAQAADGKQNGPRARL